MRKTLFLDTQNPATLFSKEREKTAGMQVPLPKDSQMWERAVITEAYRQVPFLGSYEVFFELSRNDEEQGFGFGALIVRPRSSMSEEETVQAETPIVSIPVIVRDWKMAPLDMFGFRGRYQPLTEERLSKALHRPQIFDAVRDAPPPPSIYQDMQPPEEAMYGGAMKLGASLVPILPRLNGWVRSDHVQRIKEAMRDPTIAAAVMHKEPIKAAFASALRLQSATPDQGTKDMLAALEKTASVVQLRRKGARYLVKHAQPDAYFPQEEEVDASQVEPLLSQYGMMGGGDASETGGEEPGEQMGDQLDVPPEQVPQEEEGMAEGEAPPLDEGEPAPMWPDMTVDEDEEDGTITVAPNAAVRETLDTTNISTVDRFGTYVVQEDVGQSLVGLCFPQLLSFGMEALPLTLFTNGSQYAIQEQVAGILQSISTQIPRGTPAGYGCFYFVDHGSAQAFEPVQIVGSFMGPSGPAFVCNAEITQQQIVLHRTPGLKKVVQTGDTEYAVPDDLCWLPLTRPTELVRDPRNFMKVAAWSEGELLKLSSGEFVLRGSPFRKLPKEKTAGISRDDAVFLLAAAGVEPKFAKRATARVTMLSPVRFGNLQTITPLGQAVRTREKTASSEAFLERCKTAGIKNIDLIKEAAVLEDALTADKVLSLGLVNPENIGAFVELLPSFEETLNRVCSMLIAARTGMQHIPETALERIMSGMSTAIQGLHRLQATDQHKE